MDLVQPIRDISKIEEVKSILAKNGTRDLLLFVIGINSGLRISDILPLKKSDVITGTVTLKEEKTNKTKQFPLNPKIMEILKTYIETLQDDEYLFPSRSNKYEGTYVDKKTGEIKDKIKREELHLSRQQAYNIINNACKQAGIKEAIGTHTLRKTFGYWHYNQNKDVATLQMIFNHSAPSITLKYIGITQDEINKSYMNFGL